MQYCISGFDQDAVSKFHLNPKYGRLKIYKILIFHLVYNDNKSICSGIIVTDFHQCKEIQSFFS